jgi:hypothetical protein
MVGQLHIREYAQLLVELTLAGKFEHEKDHFSSWN